MKRAALFLFLTAALALPTALRGGQSGKAGASDKTVESEFHLSNRCVACHNELKTSSGEDVSIGFQWRGSIMANSSRDPYWQASVRRESMDHPDAIDKVENECSICHMPLSHYAAKSEGKQAKIFDHLPISYDTPVNAAAADGVSCSMCHQIQKERLGTKESFNGNVVIAGPSDKTQRPEFGPFEVTDAHKQIMHSSTGKFIPTQADHIRDSALCGSCHTLITTPIVNGKEVGTFPEQMPYPEWLHSSYANTPMTCQACHMPEVNEAVPVTSVFGQPRQGMHRHQFLGGNFFLAGLLNTYRDELGTVALPQELTASAENTRNFLQTQSARVTFGDIQGNTGTLHVDVKVENLTGHKLPTAYPSRRAWLHLLVRDHNGNVIFESGKLNPDGSIVGNATDEDARSFEPYYHEITRPDQVEIFEPILKDDKDRVTTGLLSTVAYMKDSRILPLGFDKTTAEDDIKPVGEAYNDPDFTGGSATVHYAIDTSRGAGPFHIEAELWYQPIGYRWAHNLEPYQSMETQRMVRYYITDSQATAVVLASAKADH